MKKYTFSEAILSTDFSFSRWSMIPSEWFEKLFNSKVMSEFIPIETP